MMNFIKIDPKDYPLAEGESWWIIHPNIKGGQFVIPNGAYTACLGNLLDFKKGILYKVYPSGSDGWVCVASNKNMVELPQYLFARHFDAEIFIRGTPTVEEVDQLLNGKWVD